MKVITTIQELKTLLSSINKTGEKKTGFVPTMGALHEGHLTLLKEAKKESDIVICSIYVNPTQFNNSSDFDNYPITLEEDKKGLISVGCDVLFLPETKEIFPDKPLINFSFGKLESVLEGKFRPDHFNGVALVVSKLFNIVSPDFAYFGQKDYQQFAIIQQLVKDLSFQIQLRCVNTVREESGLAMSSRNMRLTAKQLESSPFIYNMLLKANEDLKNGEKPSLVKGGISQLFDIHPDFELEYFEISHPSTLQPVETIENGAIISVAAFMGEIRLIDNILI